MSSKRKNGGKGRDGEKFAKSGGAGSGGKSGEDVGAMGGGENYSAADNANLGETSAVGDDSSGKNFGEVDDANIGGADGEAGGANSGSGKADVAKFTGGDDDSARDATPDGSEKPPGAGVAQCGSGDALPASDDFFTSGTAPRPYQKSDATPNRQNQRRLKQVDARALANLLCWSIDLIDRQRNLLRTALDVVRDPEQ